jgi:hypothetical protein
MDFCDALNQDILAPYLNTSTKCAILSEILGSSYNAQDQSQDQTFYDSYLRYYSDQCRIALHTKGLDRIIATHADVINIIIKIRDPDMPREVVISSLRTRCLATQQTEGFEKLLSSAVDLAARLWLMIDIGLLPQGFTPGQRPLLWETGLLKDRLENRFGSSRYNSMMILRVKLDRTFTARNLERIAGLQIVWTDNIAEHLRLTVDDTRIEIYHHASFLEHQRSNSVFPEGFIEETIHTLSLLFPKYDKKSCNWFKAQQIRFGLDKKACCCGHLTTEERQIERFVYWHDRLGILKQVFDEAEPATLSQWWHDKRRKVQWYTFWVAFTVVLLTIFFGIVQCIEGGFQVYKAYNP